ncbi:polysaccharide deacetylase family protein [Alkalihalobacillus sp. MEB130]|uniref:polysaccharide deacetylase family protein n=1 Tax=Alkalihalobacillus sp. MEB130 TaxID=2976704 RepID=UPI0028DE2D81|nr:polysaccharide deacetylase family protein [Alkalihalobacillus sp. MEB130]MDT8861614.1 polysaccharide deacetylase family protein [Alkalihalobacillus sp. MEB130]
MVTTEVVYNLEEENILTNVRNRNETGIILTFDDGPSKYLNEFLDVLEEENVEAMFFWQTRLLHHKRPWNRVVANGHQIGAHTHRHPNLSLLRFDDQLHEIQTSKETIEQVTGKAVQYFRPPFGQYNEETLAITKQLQLETVMWDIASFDWELKQHPDQIVENIMNHVQEGSILLLHELEQTLIVLPILIQKLKASGYHFSTL